MKKKSIALLLALVMLLSVLSEGASVTAFADDNSESVSCHISSASHGRVQGVFTNHYGNPETTSISGEFTSSAKPGTEFKVTAFPDDGYYFTGWWLHDDTSGRNYDLVSYSPTYSFTANERISLQATFAYDAERCIVNGTAGGGVKMEFIQENGNSDSMSASNNANMSAVVKHNTEVTLTATPQDTYAFMGWYDYEGGNCLSTDAAYTFSFTAQTHIKAVFKAPSVVTYKVVNGTWSDGTTADKTETVQSGSKPANVPTGMKASEGYTGGAWDKNPAETTITGETTFKYTFVEKTPAVVKTAPEAKTLTYNGQAQALVTAGTADGGTMQYALGTKDGATGEYTTSIPTATDAGTYYVWYKVVGDENHNDSEPDCVTSTIKKKSAPVSVYYELILSTTEGASGEPTSSVRSPILAGASVTVTAADPAEGCRFAGWFLGDVCVSEEQVYTFVMRSYTKLQARYEADSKDGLVLDPDGVWRVYEDNVFREDYIGLYEYDGGLFFIANGELCADANGLNLNGADGKWYFLANGQVQTRHSGFAEYDGSWFMIEKGMLDENANGLYEYDGGVFAFAAGRLRTDINGLWLNPLDNRWYFLANGQVQTQHTGVAGYDGAFFVIADGELDSDYNGRIWYDGALFNVVCGQLYGPVEEESYAGEEDSFEAAEAVEYADEESFEGTETAYAENDEEEPEREEAVVDEAEESADIVVENPAEAESAA